MNKCIFTGYVAQRPELKQTTSGVSFCEFDIAVPRRKKSGEKTIWDYFTFKAWREAAENCTRFLDKGTKITVVGECQTSVYEDKNHVKRKKYEFNLSEWEFCERKQSQTPPQTAQNPQEAVYGVGQANTPPDAQMSQNGSTGFSQPYSGPAPQYEALSDDDELPF